MQGVKCQSWAAMMFAGLSIAVASCIAEPATDQAELSQDVVAQPQSCPRCPAPRRAADGALVAQDLAPLDGDAIAQACSCTQCGDGVCQAGEDTVSCPWDCTTSGGGGGGGGRPVCGNHVCESLENLTCPTDCCGSPLSCPNPP